VFCVLQIDDIVPDGEFYHINRCFELELLHDMVFVRFHSPHTEKEFFCNFFIGKTIAPHFHDFYLARAQAPDVRTLIIGLQFGDILVHEQQGNGIAVIIMTVPEGENGLDEFITGGVPGQETLGSGLDGPEDNIFIVVYRHDEYPDLGEGAAELRDKICDRVAVGMNIKDQHMNGGRLQTIRQLVAMIDFQYNVDFIKFFEQGANTFLHDLVLIEYTESYPLRHAIRISKGLPMFFAYRSSTPEAAP
jgi:hypothetical protein